MPNGAAGFLLLGRIARLSTRQLEAADFYSEALSRDPLLWQAFEELCSLGTGRHAIAQLMAVQAFMIKLDL